MLSKEFLMKSMNAWIRFVQVQIQKDLEISTDEDSSKVKVLGRFRKLAPFLDSDEVWRVGKRVREYTPFTLDNKPPALLPQDSRFTLILMREAHERRHGV